MYNIGDLVVYCSHGVCRIEDTEQRVVDKKTVNYYVLCPLEGAKTKFYVPVHNPAAVAKMRYLVTKEQLQEILSNPDIFTDCWIAEENRRKMRYKELSGCSDLSVLLQMVHTLQQQKQTCLSQGKKFHQSDENFLRDSKRVLEFELSYVLDVPANQVQDAVQALMQR